MYSGVFAQPHYSEYSLPPQKPNHIPPENANGQIKQRNDSASQNGNTIDSGPFNTTNNATTPISAPAPSANFSKRVLESEREETCADVVFYPPLLEE